jgi:hypothetical protein
MTLSGPDGDINERFPSSAVSRVKKGDVVTIGVGLMEQNAPSASPHTSNESGGTPSAHSSSSSMPSSTSSSSQGGSK